MQKIIFWIFLFTAIFSQYSFSNSELNIPQYLYHFGHKKYMLQNAMEGNIPQEVWEKNIMGNESRYPLPPYRKGLYGCSRAENAEYYGHLMVGKDAAPWFMEIKIKDECRKKEFYFDLQKVSEDPIFSSWYTQKELKGDVDLDWNGFLANCLTTFSSELGKNIPQSCQDTIEKYYEDQEIKIVVDHYWKDSWYIRDRNCIENIKADYSDILEIMSEQDYWLHPGNRSSSLWVRPGAVSFMILVESLIGSQEVKNETLLAIEKSILRSEISTYPVSEKSFWIRSAGKKVVDSFSRCQNAGQLESFNSSALEFIERNQKKDHLKNKDLNIDQIFELSLSELLLAMDEICKP